MEHIMPQFSNDLPSQTSSVPFDLKRTPPTGTLTGVITSESLTSVRTHFANNRTVPCEAPEHCLLCQDGHAWRSHVYVAVIDFKTYEHFLLETTAKAASTLVIYRDYHKTLRGCAIRCSRRGDQPNGRIRIETRRTDPAKTVLPEPPNVQRLLCHIWNIPYAEEKNLDLRQLFKIDPEHQNPEGNGRNKNQETGHA